MANDTRNQTGANPYRYVLILLFAGYLLSFADRIVFGLVLKPIKVTLALSDSQAGLLAGAAFAVAYAIFAPAGGYFIDRHPRRPIFAFAVAFWSAATFSCGLAGSFIAMGLSRAAVGAGEALLHPLSVSLIGDTVRPESRAKAFAFYFSAGTFGTLGVLLGGGALFQWISGMPPLSLPLIGAIQPWQALFMVLAIPGLLLALVVLAMMKEPPRHGPAHGAGAADENSARAFLRANPGLGVAFFIGFPLLQMAGYTFLSWVFIFFDRVHGWPAGKAGVAFALTGGVTFIVGALLSGHIVGLIRKRGYVDASLRACILGGVAFSSFGAAALLMPTPYLALTMLAIAFFFGYLPTIGGYSAVSEVVPPTMRAGLAGFNTLSIGLITNSLGPFMVGFFSDHLYPGTTGIRWAMLTMAAISAIAGTAAVAAGLGPFCKRIAQGVETEVTGAAVAPA
jgi:MFS family permease